LVEYEYAVEFPEGKFYYESRIVPAGGNLYISFVRNITEKKISEDKIKQQAERLAGIVKAIPDLMFVSDKAGRYIEYYKPENYNMLLHAENLQGKTVFDVFEEPTALMHVEKINQCLKTKTLVSYEYESADRGKIKYYDARIVPLNDEHVLRFVRDITERKEAELKIRKLTLAVEQSPAIILITGTEGDIQYVNPVFSEISGFTAEEVIGKNPGMLKSGKTDPETYKNLWETITKGKSWRGEWQNKKKTGELYWEDVTISPIFDDNGAIINYLAIKQDITRRKKSEAELLELNANLEKKVAERTEELAAKNEALHSEITERELANEAMMLSEMRLELAMEAARMAWWEMEIETGHVMFHKRKTEMLGRRQEDFGHYNDFMKLVHPDDYEKAMTAMRKHFTGQAHVYQTEYRIQKTDGQYLWFHDIGSISQRDENGKPLYVVGFVTDISQRKFAEVALKEKTRELEEFFSLTLDLMLIADTDGNFIKKNSAWEKRLGFSEKELLSKRFIEFIHPDDLQATYDAMSALSQQKPVIDFTNRYKTKTGNYRYLNWSAVPVGSKFYAAARDFTERLETEEQLRRATIEAETANKAKSEFLSRMSHELRTPMNSILGFAQLLEMGQLNPKQMKGVKHIISSGKHLLDLINEVLDISRIEAGRLSISIEPVNLNKLLMEVIDSIRPQLEAKNLSMRFVDSPYNNFSVRSDRQRLKQVLINLLNNAVKYNTENGSITIEIRPFGSGSKETKLLRISITDTGKGISEQNLKKLFVPFERIGAERTNTEGTGLGLTVVKKLTEAMGGRVGVESTEGNGSTFWVELPAVENQLEQALKSGTLSAKPSDVAETSGVILYVEDNDSNVDLVKQILEEKRPGIQLIATTYGLRALDLALEHNPGLVLLDLNLPDIQGDEVLKRLKSDKRTTHIPVIMLSADAMPRQVSKLLKAGANEYLTKPIDVITFLEILDEIFEN
jgi:PAS domain S-box-containing protein